MKRSAGKENLWGVPPKVLREIKRINELVLPREQYLGSLTLAASAFEELYFGLKIAIDEAIHASEKLLYTRDYHEKRLAQYAGQKRLLVFVPGYMLSPTSFYRLERLLGNELFRVFTYIWGDFPYSQDVTLSALQLEAKLRELVKHTKAEEIYLVGHSQGGMIIRTVVQHGMGKGLPIRKCLFLSSPHQGTWVGLGGIPHGGLRFLVGLIPYIGKVQGESGLQLMPGSDFLRELNARPLPEQIQFTSVFYAYDPLIWPPTNAILPYPEAQNHFVNKIGHAQPLYCSRAAQIAVRALYGEEAQQSGIVRPMGEGL